MDKIKELKHELYVLALTRTINELESNDKVKWPIEYNFDKAYEYLKVYFEMKGKALHALEKLGNKEECYFMIREKVKQKNK